MCSCNGVSICLVSLGLFYSVHMEESDTLSAAFTNLEGVLENMIENQEKQYEQVFKRIYEAQNGTLSTTVPPEKEDTCSASTIDIHKYDPPENFTEVEKVEALSDAMGKLENRAFDMLKSHTKIMQNEVDIVKKVDEYEQKVNRVGKMIPDSRENSVPGSYQEEVKELVKKKDQVVSQKGAFNGTMRDRINQFVGRNLTRNDLGKKDKYDHRTLRGAIVRLEFKVEKMVKTQLGIMEHQSRVMKMIDNYNQQLDRALQRFRGTE